jgi:hypothetical protein
MKQQSNNTGTKEKDDARVFFSIQRRMFNEKDRAEMGMQTQTKKWGVWDVG